MMNNNEVKQDQVNNNEPAIDNNNSNTDNTNDPYEYKPNVDNEANNYNIEPIDNFDNMNLKDNLLRGIYSMGFEKPSYIQKCGIIPIVKGNDVIAQSQSGTGKTATFVISALQIVDETLDETQILIIAPIRELALQIYDVVMSIGNYIKTSVACIIGGTSIKENISTLSKKPKIIIGTPGRLYDMIYKRYLRTETIRLLVIDEADEMLSKGFEEQIKTIFKNLHKNIQVALFSATMNQDFFYITTHFMNNPVKILVKDDELTLDGISQYYVYLDRNYKFDALCDLYQSFTISQSILYCNSKKTVEYLHNRLQENNFSAIYIHGDMPQEKRREIMHRFRSGEIRMLISTDLLCRGIDVQQVSLVINYDVPYKIQNYIHRIGRSGRFGRKGVAINFANEKEYGILKDIEKYYSTTIDELPSDIKSILI